MLIKEFCAENYTNIPAAIANGAKRIELCDNLSVGGTTPSTGVIEESFAYASEKDVSLVTMIRPRAGDFIYNDIELRIMETDLIEAKKLGVDGIVLGCLTPNNWLDEEALDRLIEAATGLQITFHMAFDQIAKDRQYEAIDWLSERGVTRILTHGGPSDTAITENINHLIDLNNYANNRITILPGGGITSENIEEIVRQIGVNEAHGTKIVSF
ncbi:copper homeostasis protein CutC [Tetragenococcus halophilus]|uniref:PF03932 family protein CutC n=1 Tax=Tetragenococcus halophilus subsp. halophilus TaxID=1513897 RepID=A0A2H6DJ16_TETHA|nr:copper homeostasis protein CutC [Tetragenococcus halophilus]AOF49464.1 copper homeostasis protein CutC [Tetragenococcus halophilus]MCO8284663.1 copper homeostasis protein CutC [Tetragenococcus halophilus]MCO8285969.1 copper homeostasis protein CutC [Tetragenococcus halophilus]MCO8293427.1 copper homeostasis protein CutC [Tetragenococcus halophilus]GBD65545.1 putative copper homeostasis protein CutC [Tetragenococcus halophilus subsp. halophilus]